MLAKMPATVRLLLLAILLLLKSQSSFSLTPARSALRLPSYHPPHSTTAAAAATPAAGAPSCYILLSNLQSGSNIGAICRNALSFNVSEVVIVGRPNSWKSKMRSADRGAKNMLKFESFPSTQLAAAYLKEERGCTIIGLEIMPQAKSLVSYAFPPGNCAFVFGNEGGGLSETQRALCDDFVYIPQYSAGMASINVACVSAITLQRFAVHAQYRESLRAEGAEKFM